ncbi:hypothetical protein H2200_009320 [Cladophialophora chaetospira]|uniref:Transcription factor domain-containing protein n=1 Tax=Cladophialophora chaetospira TaxID=386627 RepID=A0AA38X3W1_9EURO|nr:hypothetical protein H2200_009320 [Cladophialophora chaetospira]
MFDQTIIPDVHYQRSQLLFWAIVGTGARRYKRDPTIFDRITKRFTEKPLSLECIMHNPTAAVQALVVLCMWPSPVTSVFKDASPAWAGMATSLAIQTGLHAICKEEEFARKPATRRPLVGTPAARFVHSDGSPATSSARAKIAFRTSLWTNCLIACQSTMICDGLLPITVPANENLERQQLITYMLGDQVNLRYRLYVVQTDAVAAIRRTIDLESVSCGAELVSLINIFDKQLNTITIDCTDTIGLISRDCARLMILCFHFFVQIEHIDRHGFLQIFTIAQQVILQISELDTAHGFVEYLPIYYARMVCLAAYCILRISKSGLREELKLEDPGGVFFKAIEISKRRSVQHGDLDALNSIMLTKLWSSNEIFVQPDGTRNSLHLDLRGRLAMSVAFDCFWWWRKEFGYLFNDSIPASEETTREYGDIYTEEKSLAISAGTSNQTMAGEPNLGQYALDLTDFSGWDWNIGLTPLESMSF